MYGSPLPPARTNSGSTLHKRNSGEFQSQSGHAYGNGAANNNSASYGTPVAPLARPVRTSSIGSVAPLARPVRTNSVGSVGNKYNRRSSGGSWSVTFVGVVRFSLFVILGLTYLVCNRRVAWVKKQLSLLTEKGGMPRELKGANQLLTQQRRVESDLSRKFNSARADRDAERTKKEKALSALEKTKTDLEEAKKTGRAPKTADDAVTDGMSTLELDSYNKRMIAMTQIADNLEARIQDISHHDVTEKFGEGPYKVEFQLQFPNPPPGVTESSSFIVEMAPLDEMPHSVDLFLEMVDHKLWDNTAFILNEKHVLQAAAVASNGVTLERKKFEFKDSRLESVAFQEYSSSFPHKQYTLGFAGRPGGPDFYINMLDNSIDHGPGGQSHHALLEDADPCFAKVISGFEAVKNIAFVPSLTALDSSSMVMIKSARIIKI